MALPTLAADRLPANRLPADRYYLASQWQLMWHKFRRHRLALIGGAIMLVLYTAAILADLVTPYLPEQRFPDLTYHPPSAIRVFDQGRLRLPFLYHTLAVRDPSTLGLSYTVDQTVTIPVRFLARGEPHKLLGLIPTDRHLFSVDAPNGIFVLGTYKLGRDVFSRTIYAARLSLSVGLIGVALSFLIGITLGGIYGYFDGAVDTLIQRVIEFLIAIPTIPLWIALSAALPRNWSVVQVYFGIVIILSLVGWGGLARVVRSKLLELRELDYVLAARVAGVSEADIIRVHLLPNFASYLIVSLTLDIPGVILGETALSFLGLGLRAPAVSWGVLLQDAQNIHSIALYWWTVTPALFVVVTVLAFNFLGDGLRDAADPYKI